MRCSKWVLYSLLCVLLASGAYVYAAGQLTPAARGTEGAIAVQEVDGAPNVGVVTGLKVTDGSLTDNGDGTVTIATSGAANMVIGTSTITGGVPSGLLYVGTGPVLQQVSINGLVFGNGASAPGAYGGTSCTNQAVTALNASGVATCTTLTSAYVDTSVITDGSLGVGVKTFLGTPSSANLAAAVTGETGTGALVFGTGPTITLENGTGLPIATGVSGLGTGVATFLGTPSSANFAAAITDETGSGSIVFGTAPTISSAVLSTKVNLPRVTAFPGTPAAGDTVIITDDSTKGACDSAAGSAVTLCQYNGTSWVSLGDGGAGGSIGGSTGSTDRAVIIANGTGGSTVQGSGCTISAGNTITCPGGFIGGTSGTGVVTLLEGTAPGAGTNAGEHNIYFDATDSKLKSHENGGSVVTYARTADNLSVFGATTSAQLAGNISDEVGSGALVFGTSPTLTTPTISGAISFPDGVTQTFNPSGTAAGLNFGAVAIVGDPSTANNGDCYYNNDAGSNKFRCRQNGAWVDMINTGAGSGDITDVNGGAGITITNPGGLAGVVGPVDWTPNTFVNNITLWDAANASRTLTAGLSGATDPVITFSNASVDVTTGTLKEGGSSVSLPARTETLTNKTLDAEGTGNTLTLPRRIWLPAAGCNNATAGSIWDLPSASPAVAACVTGTNTQKGVLDFSDTSNLSAQMTWKLPSTWTGNIDANIKWFSAVTTGDVVWQLATICVADAETDDPAFNTASTVTDTTKGTANQTNDAAITSVTATGCAAGELMHLKIFRDSAHASDTMAGTARLIGVELVVREAL